MATKNDQRFWLAAGLAVVLLSLVPKLYATFSAPLWLDEAYTVWFSNQTFVDLWTWVPTFESHPPLYYSFMKMLTILPFSEGIVFRLASLVCNMVTIVAAAVLVRKIGIQENAEHRFHVFFVVLFVSLHPELTWYASEARPYAYEIMMISLCMLSAYDIGNAPENAGFGKWLQFSVLVALLNYAHYSAPLFGLSFYIYLFACNLARGGNVKAFGMLIASGVLVTILCAPMLYFVAKQVMNWSGGSWVEESSMRYVITKVYTIGKLGYFNQVLLERGWTLLCYAAIVIVYLKNIRALGSALALCLLLIALAPTAMYLVTLLGPNIFLPRLIVPLALPFGVLIAVALVKVRNRYIVTVLCCVTAASFAFQTYTMMTEKPKGGYLRAFSVALQEEYQPDDLLLFLPNSLELPLSLELEGLKNVPLDRVALPHVYPAIGVSDFYPAGTPSVPGLTEADADLIKAKIGSRNRVLVLTRIEELFDPSSVLRRTLAEMGFRSVRSMGEDIRPLYFDVYER
ncbi:hypothetical protein [Hwanghaeella grinnelliae]|nr:hypothetical protein [Hwanghaeella grinnelliae]